MAELIEYEIKVREQQALAAMDKYTRALEGAARAEKQASLTADQHSQALRAQARMSEVMERQQQRANAALAASSQASAAAAGGVNNLGQNTARVLSTLNGFGVALGGIDGNLGAMVSSVGRASGAVAAMSSFLGGPMGVAIGAAVAGVGLLSQAFKENAEDAKAAADSQDAYVKALAETEKAARSASAATFNASVQRAQQIRIGLVDNPNDPDLLNAQASPERLAAMNALEKSEFGDKIPAEKGSGEDPRKKAFEELEKERKALAALEVEQLNMEYQETLRVTEEKAKAQRAAFEEYEKLRKEQSDLEFQQLDMEYQETVRVAEAKAAAHKKAAAEKEKADAEAAKKQEEAAKKEAAQRQQVEDAFASIGAAAITSAAAAAGAGESMGKAMEKAVGAAIVADGTKNILQGTGMIISSLFTNPAGYALVALGATEVAVGTKMGASGGGAGAGVGAGGGGARKAAFTDARTGQPVYDDGLGPASPTLVAPSKSTGSQQGGNTYVFQSTFAPRPEDAIQMKRTAEQGARQGYT